MTTLSPSGVEHAREIEGGATKATYSAASGNSLSTVGRTLAYLLVFTP